MWIGRQGQLYEGDCLIGDRRATDEEVAAWQSASNAARLASIAVSPWQIRKALNALGLRDSVEAAVAAGDQTVKDAWQYATEVRRDNPLVNGVATALGKTEAEIDELFLLAVAL